MEIAEQKSIFPSSYISIDHTMKMRTREKPHTCPWCSSGKIAILLNGMPVFIPELEEDLDDGGIAIGGLRGGLEEPAWQCTECSAHFYREETEL